MWLLVWLGACGAPRLEGDNWALWEPLLGPGLVNHTPGCTLVFGVNVPGRIGWPESCGRGDLPTEITHVPLAGPGHLYEVSGGNETDAQWYVRDGDHPGLFELWVFGKNFDIDSAYSFDANQVIPIWRFE